jgi:hypothetical protein
LIFFGYIDEMTKPLYKLTHTSEGAGFEPLELGRVDKIDFILLNELEGGV